MSHKNPFRSSESRGLADTGQRRLIKEVMMSELNEKVKQLTKPAVIESNSQRSNSREENTESSLDHAKAKKHEERKAEMIASLNSLY